MKNLKLKLASLQRKDMILHLEQERLMIKGERKGKDYSVELSELNVKRAKVQKKYRKIEEKLKEALFQEGIAFLFQM